jgi:hypothetical protein
VSGQSRRVKGGEGVDDRMPANIVCIISYQYGIDRQLLIESTTCAKAAPCTPHCKYSTISQQIYSHKYTQIFSNVGNISNADQTHSQPPRWRIDDDRNTTTTQALQTGRLMRHAPPIQQPRKEIRNKHQRCKCSAGQHRSQCMFLTHSYFPLTFDHSNDWIINRIDNQATAREEAGVGNAHHVHRLVEDL